MERMLALLLGLLLYTSSAYGIDIFGHRGARGLVPENTLPSFRTALALGVNYVDMDVNMTKDGHVVVVHGFTLDPDKTRDFKGRWLKKTNIIIKDLTLAELETYDVGRMKPGSFYTKLFPEQFAIDHTSVPTLKRAIDYIKSQNHNVKFQLEIEANPTHPDWSVPPAELVNALVNIIEKEGIVDRTVIQSFDLHYLLEVQKVNPKIATAYITGVENEEMMYSANVKKAGLWTDGHLLKNYQNSIPKMVAALGGKFWNPQDTELTAEQLQEAHSLGLKVVTWSYPKETHREIDSALIEKLIDMNVDGIITDRPDILRGIMAARNKIIPSIC